LLQNRTKEGWLHKATDNVRAVLQIHYGAGKKADYVMALDYGILPVLGKNRDQEHERHSWLTTSVARMLF